MSTENHAPPQNPVPAPGHAARRFSQEINRVINAFSQELAPHELVGLIQLQQHSLTGHILNIVRREEVEESMALGEADAAAEKAAEQNAADGLGTPIVPEEAIPRLQPET